MSIPPQAYLPQHTILELGDVFYDPVEAARFPQTVLRFRNDRAASEVGLSGLSETEWLAHFGGFVPLPDNLEHPSRSATTATSSASIIPKSATGAAFCSRN